MYAHRTRARVRTGSYTGALRETSAGLRLVQGLDSAAAIGVRATLRAMRSAILMLQGRPREAIPLAEAAVESGKAAGVFAIGVSWGKIHPPERLLEAGADVIVHSPEELLGVL